MRYIYRSGNGFLFVEHYDGKELAISWEEHLYTVPVEKDTDSGDRYFSFHGEMFFLDDWARLELDPDANHLPEVGHEPSQPLDRAVFFFVIKNALSGAVYEIREDHGDIAEWHTFRISGLLNKDKTGMYRLCLAECGTKEMHINVYYSVEFKELIQKKMVRRTN